MHKIVVGRHTARHGRARGSAGTQRGPRRKKAPAGGPARETPPPPRSPARSGSAGSPQGRIGRGRAPVWPRPGPLLVLWGFQPPRPLLTGIAGGSGGFGFGARHLPGVGLDRSDGKRLTWHRKRGNEFFSMAKSLLIFGRFLA